uniref:L1 transposable element RRM domain-containing protein n=1 Tax=Latimeria chalumnae TaxID=7897 RepID=H3ATU2_LATCH
AGATKLLKEDEFGSSASPASMSSSPTQEAGEITADVPADIKVIMGTLQQILSTIEEIKKTNQDFIQRLNDLEHRTGTLKDRVTTTEDQISALQAKVAALSLHVDNQENRARRNNLRFLRFPEMVEKGKPIKFLQKILPELLQLPEGTQIEMEQAHRPLAPCPAEGQRPRPLIVKFLWFPLRKLILQKARELGSLMWQGHKILIFPDLSRELQKKRKKFLDVKKKLREYGLKYGLFYPATLRISVDGEDFSFTSPIEARAFLAKW